MATKNTDTRKAIAEKVIQTKLETAGAKAIKAKFDAVSLVRRGTVRTMA